MADNFSARSDEAIVKTLTASWYKEGNAFNSQTGQLVLTSQRIVFCARNRFMTAAITGPILDQIVKSNKVRWEVQRESISAISSFKRFGIKLNFRLATNRWEGECFEFALNPGGNIHFIDWAEKIGMPVERQDISEDLSNERPLSERPKGYTIAVLGGFLGGIPGLIASPAVLHLLNKKLKRTEEKQPNRFRAWALIGVLGVPICRIVQTAIILPNPSTTTSETTTRSTQPEQIAPPPAPERWDSANKKSELEASIKENSSNQLTGVAMNIQSATCNATSDKGFWICNIRKLGDPEPMKWRVEVTDDGTWASSPIFN